MQNPFKSAEVPRAPRKRESGIFSTRMEGPRKPADIARARMEREQPKKDEEHITSVKELHDYLVSKGHQEACNNLYSCDPWMYEPILLDELIAERAQASSRSTSKGSVDKLRELIRAGSWMTHERVLKDDALEQLKRVTQLEEQDWQTKIRHADPDTSKELKGNLKDAQAELATVARTITDGLYGQDAEPAVRSIEDLSVQAWLELKKILISHQMDFTEAWTNPLTKPLVQELETLRPLRDYLYFEYLYPHWVKKGLPNRAA
ncbi:MAG: hypothetical protein WA001_00890 [Patescibacteria group bacterium]